MNTTARVLRLRANGARASIEKTMRGAGLVTSRRLSKRLRAICARAREAVVTLDWSDDGETSKVTAHWHWLSRASRAGFLDELARRAGFLDELARRAESKS